MRDLRDIILVALDTSRLDEALEIAEEVGPLVGGFKIGLQLFTRHGPEAVECLTGAGWRVALDLKFKDTPQTMAGAAESAAMQSAMLFTVHASAGIDGMRAAAQKKGVAKMMAVTVLTSFDEESAHRSYGGPVLVKVMQFAHDAKTAGADGIVCSPQELAFLRKFRDLDALERMVPGIRPKWAPANDQMRTMTPKEAVEAGADYIVIGRPITRPPAGLTRRSAAVRILEELDSVPV